MLATGAMMAQETPTVTLKWLTHDLVAKGFETGNVRAGSGVNGIAYISNGASIMTFDGTEVKTLYTHSSAINRGFALDEAGNIAVAASWPTAADNWDKWLLIKADGSEATPITLKAPTSCADWVGDRTDLVGRAVGDFYGEDGGLFFLTTKNVAFPIPVWITEGVQETFEYGTSARFAPAATNLGYANPRYSLEETSFNDAADAFYFAGTNGANIGYVDEDGNPAYFDLPALEGSKFQNGFDVFELGGKTYAVHVYDNTLPAGTNWGSNFIIWDVETGDVIFTSNYSIEGGNDGNVTGDGCSFVARKVSENKVELYQCYCGGGDYKANSFNALYEITLPVEPSHLYIAGAFQDWNPNDPAEFTLGEDGLYTYNYTQTQAGGFKISTAKGDWDAEGGFNSGLLGVKSQLVTGNTYDLVPGYSNDLSIYNGEYTFTVDLENLKLTVTGEEAPFEIPELYVRGELNSWGFNDETKMAHGDVAADGALTYTITLPTLEGEFKLANDNWGVNFGGAAINGNGTYDVANNGDNMKLVGDYKNVKLTLKTNKNNINAGTLTIAGTLYAPLHAFAYDVKGAMGENDVYNATFKLTEAADEVVVTLYNAEGEVAMTQAAQNLAKGENTIAVNLADLEIGNYTWSVKTISSNDLENGALGFAGECYTQNADGSYKNTTGGVVFMSDPTTDAYGYTVLGLGMASGFAVYTPDNTLVEGSPFHVGFEKLNASNGSSVTRGDDLRNYAVFADWSDKASGYWRLDVLNPAAEPVNMLMSEGAIQEPDGTVILNDVEIGSGSPCVAFSKKGMVNGEMVERTQMWAFDEDVYGNVPVQYDLGDALYVTEAPTWVFEGGKGIFANTNIWFVPVENGYFVTQNRASIADSGVPALMYFTYEHELLWNASESTTFTEDNGFNGANSGFAVSNDGTMAVIGSYNQMVTILSLEYNEYGEPEFTKLYDMPIVANVTGKATWAHIQFDAANNILMFDRRSGALMKYVLPGTSEANIPAKEEYVIAKVDGLSNVIVGAENAPVQYFNLQGVAVDADNLTPGIYVRRQGNNASKVVIR